MPQIRLLIFLPFVFQGYCSNTAHHPRSRSCFSFSFPLPVWMRFQRKETPDSANMSNELPPTVSASMDKEFLLFLFFFFSQAYLDTVLKQGDSQHRRHVKRRATSNSTLPSPAEDVEGVDSLVLNNATVSPPILSVFSRCREFTLACRDLLI